MGLRLGCTGIKVHLLWNLRLYWDCDLDALGLWFTRTGIENLADDRAPIPTFFLSLPSLRASALPGSEALPKRPGDGLGFWRRHDHLVPVSAGIYASGPGLAHLPARSQQELESPCPSL